MPRFETILRSEEARVLVLSQRGRAPVASRCMVYEFERIISEVDCADIIALNASMDGRGIRRRLVKRLGGLGAIGSRSRRYTGRRYDMLFVPIQSITELRHLGPIEPWLACADVTVCMIDEVWAKRIPEMLYEVSLLKQFDLAVIGCAGGGPALSDRLGRTAHYVAPGIDTVSFCPWPDPPERRVDIYGMGRRSPITHSALIDFAARTRRFYLYDTLSAYSVKDVAEHRRLLASLVKRSRYFLAYRAKVTADDQTGRQEETGSRFFEGAAGGAVIVGDAPQTDLFRQQFPHDDAVLPLPFDTDDVAGLFEELDADPARVQRVRRANVEASLSRHDWLYRWEAILKLAGMSPPPLSGRRREVIDSLLRSVRDGAHSVAPPRSIAGERTARPAQPSDISASSA